MPTRVELCVGVTTAPRTTDYLTVSLASLLDSLAASELWLPCVDIYAEPGSTVPTATAKTPLARTRWHWHQTQLGNWHNWRFAAADLLQRYVTASTYLIVEDDVQYARSAIQLAHQFTQLCAARAQFGFLSLYRSGTQDRRLRSVQDRISVDTITAADEVLSRFWGACALVFTRDSLQALLAESNVWLGLAHERDKSHVPATMAAVDGRDIAIYQAAVRLKRRAWFLRPSAVQHIGASSSVMPDATLSESRRAGDTLAME